jgi:hypothetical protein
VAALRPEFRGSEESGKVFGPEQAVLAEAPAYDRLAAFWAGPPTVQDRERHETMTDRLVVLPSAGYRGSRAVHYDSFWAAQGGLISAFRVTGISGEQ